MQLLLAAATKCSNHHRLSHSMHLLQSTSTSFRGATLWPAQRVTSSCSVFQLGARATSTASSTASATSNNNTTSSVTSATPFFHSRQRTMQYLSNHCSSPPDSITVILGPRNAGKSALIRELIRTNYSNGGRSSTCYINGRTADISTPASLAEVLLQSGLPMVAQQMFPGVQGAKPVWSALQRVVTAAEDKLRLGDKEININGKLITAVMEAVLGDKEHAPPLTVVVDAYAAMLDAWAQAHAAGCVLQPGGAGNGGGANGQPSSSSISCSPPVLVLDEAHVLMQWGEEHKREQQQLLRFFVEVTQATNRSHVILLTSSYTFIDWLSNEIGPQAFDTFCIGNFSQQQARQFLDTILRQQLGQPPVADADWQAVHQVCGGNAGTLRKAARSFAGLGGWQPALAHLAKDTWIAMRHAYQPRPGAGYTASDYATAVKAILESPYSAVDSNLLQVALGGAQPLEAMVAAGQLAMRPFSPWAHDIDAAAFGERGLAVVVTAPSSMHLHLMTLHRDELLAPLLQKQQSTQGTSGTSSGADTGNSSPTPHNPASTSLDTQLAAVAADMAEVKASIAAVETVLQQLQDSASQVRQQNAEGWQEELQPLQAERLHVLKKEQQLREQLRLLHEEKLLLLRRQDNRELGMDGYV